MLIVKRAAIIGLYVVAYPVAAMRIARKIRRGEFPPPTEPLVKVCPWHEVPLVDGQCPYA